MFLDGITFSYRWKEGGIFKKDTTLRLVLKIENENAHRVLVRFRVNYYWKATLNASSQMVEYCIKPERTIRGRMWDLVFSSGKFSKEQIFDDMFMWELSDIEILHNADCETRLNIKMKPGTRKMNPKNNEETK